MAKRTPSLQPVTWGAVTSCAFAVLLSVFLCEPGTSATHSYRTCHLCIRMGMETLVIASPTPPLRRSDRSCFLATSACTELRRVLNSLSKQKNSTSRCRQKFTLWSSTMTKGRAEPSLILYHEKAKGQRVSHGQTVGVIRSGLTAQLRLTRKLRE